MLTNNTSSTNRLNFSNKYVHREHERHLGQLRNLEEELDSQVARVEAKAREEARQKFEQEKKTITKKMETEIMELQTHLRLFKKVFSWKKFFDQNWLNLYYGTYDLSYETSEHI